MNDFWVILISVFYLLLLFGIALYGHKRAKLGKSIVNNPLTYALSLTVYCTVWTFYGSVGLASRSGLEYIPVYLGPVVLIPIWYFFSRKIILISKYLRITSIADFISSRYGKSTALGVITTVVLLLGIIPYISIQLKAIGFSYDILTYTGESIILDGSNFYTDKVNYFTILLAVFTILFGTRSLDPYERHEGLVAAIAFESIVKLIAFISVGIYTVYFLFNGLSDVFSQAALQPETQALLTVNESLSGQSNWFWMMIASSMALMFLPRQFHVTVVENINISYTRQASWMLPIYLLLICIFVLPIAIAGNLLLPVGADPDAYVISLPLHFNQSWLALFAYIGGFSAAASMVVVSVIALSIMVSNNLLMPFLLKTRTANIEGFALPAERLLKVRRLIIVVVLILSYSFYALVSKNFPLVSIGLISFVAILQLAPIVIGGLFWKAANKKAAISAMIAGASIWFFALAFPTLGEAGLISNDFIQNGYFGIPYLKPYQLFGLENMTPIANACFWSLIVNTGIFTVVSFFTSSDIEELSQADIFINIEKYSEDPERNLLKRQASVPQLKRVLVRYLGSEKTREILLDYTGKIEDNPSKSETAATSEFINYVEKMLAGAFGSSSAKIILSSEITKEDIKPRQLISILDQTKKIMEYSTELERKTEQLEKASIELEEANEGLKRLDMLKAEFISTVTHELRTPITTIRSFSQILASKKDLPEEKKQDFLDIILKECDRIRRLIDQVLEVERLETKTALEEASCYVNTVIRYALERLSPQMENKGITLIVNLPEENYQVNLSEDKFLQIMLNLLSNAHKFADNNKGEIDVSVSYVENRHSICVEVFNNGSAIPERYRDTIFDKFIQVKEGNLAKPEGSGLGLYITKKFVEQAGGTIDFTSGAEEGTSFYFFLPVKRVQNQ